LHHPAHDQAYANRVNTAISLHAHYDLPDGRYSAVVEHPAALPLVLVATETFLYAIDVAPDQETGADRIASRCRALRIDRREMSIEQRAMYRHAEGGGHSRTHLWEIHSAQLSFAIRGRISATGQADEREVLARHVARQLGWELSDLD
jgi:hypothetical protein